MVENLASSGPEAKPEEGLQTDAMPPVRTEPQQQHPHQQAEEDVAPAVQAPGVEDDEPPQSSSAAVVVESSIKVEVARACPGEEAAPILNGESKLEQDEKNNESDDKTKMVVPDQQPLSSTQQQHNEDGVVVVKVDVGSEQELTSTSSPVTPVDDPAVTPQELLVDRVNDASEEAPDADVSEKMRQTTIESVVDLKVWSSILFLSQS